LTHSHYITSSHFNRIIVHINIAHTKELSFVCDECKFAANQNLKNYKKRVDNNFNQLKRDFRECQFVSRCERSLKNHKLRYTGEKPFKCYVNRDVVLSIILMFTSNTSTERLKPLSANGLDFRQMPQISATTKCKTQFWLIFIL
jgi:hypothetical protein